MPDQSVDLLLNTLRKESPIIFLGAGFSHGATLKNGQKVPLAEELKYVIIRDMLKMDNSMTDYAELSKYSLSKVCQIVERRKSKEHLNDFIANVFTGIRPQKYHYILASYPWRRIYTTNCDDLVETVFANANKELIIQNERRQSTLPISNKTEYMKLHGCVNNKAAGFVFSPEDYIDAMINREDYRYNTFCFDWQRETFLILGSQFDEQNIDYYLRVYEKSGYSSGRGRLFFINPSPTLYLLERAKQLNAVIIEWTTEQFLNQLGDLKESEIVGLRWDARISYSGYHTYSRLKDAYKGNFDYTSKLYEGEEPMWEDIFQEWDFIHPHTEIILNDIDGQLNKSDVVCLSVYGKALVGKSCLMMRMADTLDKAGYEVIYFNGKHFDTSVILKYIKGHKTNSRFALIVDNASYYYFPIRRLIRANLGGSKLAILTASREYFHIKRRYYLIECGLSEHEFNPSINEKYAETIVNKLEDKGLLGTLSRYGTKRERMAHFMKRNDLLSALLDITYGEQFEKRYWRTAMPQYMKDDDTKNIVLNLSIFDKVDIPYFPKELLGLMYSCPVNTILKRVNDYIRYTINQDICIRSSRFTNQYLKLAGRGKIKENIEKILISISPQVSEWQDSYWNVVYQSLCKAKFLRHYFGFPNTKIRALLTNIMQYYKGNSYYWIQLGIAEQVVGDYEKALNRFRQAEIIRPKSYNIKHVIGRNYILQAIDINDFEKAQNLYLEAEKIFLPLIKQREILQVKAYSIHNFIFNKIRYMKRYNIVPNNDELKEINDSIQSMLNIDQNDMMFKRLSNYFHKYLVSIRKQGLIKFGLHDLGKYSHLFGVFGANDDDILQDFGSELD